MKVKRGPRVYVLLSRDRAWPVSVQSLCFLWLLRFFLIMCMEFTS